MKICSHCKCLLDFSKFTKHPASADGYKHLCRECNSAYDKLRYPMQREKMIERAREWNVKHPDRVRASGRRVDKKRLKARALDFKAYASKVRTATPPWADMHAIKEAYEVAAVLSRSGLQFHVDHEVPLRGKLVSGLHVETNLRVVPWHVNLRKGAKHAT